LKQTTIKRKSIPARTSSIVKDRVDKIVEFEPRQTKRAFEHIVEQIRNRIYKGLFNPGDRLPSERELAERFHTARLAVRAAFRVLEESGLIHIKKGKMGGAYIKEFTGKNVSKSLVNTIEDHMPSMEDLMEARACVESSIVALAIERMTGNDLDALNKNIAETGRLIRQGGSSADVQIRFHVLLAKAAHNSTLESVLQSILNVFGLFLIKEFDPPRDHLEKHLADHRNILKAIEQKQSDLARKKILSHIKYFSKHFSVLNNH